MPTPLLTRRKQILSQVEATAGTAETLTAAVGKARVTVATSATYEAPREERDIARPNLAPMGTLESTKAISHTIECELNTPDTYALKTAMVCTTAAWQSGNLVKYSFSGTPTLSTVSIGDILVVRNTTTQDAMSGTYPITAVDDALDTITAINREVTSASTNETGNTATAHVLAKSEFGPLMDGCGNKHNAIFSVAIGSITSGPFQRGETVTDGVTGATGRVLKETATGTTPIYVIPTNRFKFASGSTITGGTSGATATASGNEALAGYSITPLSSNLETITLRNEEDGFKWESAGTMGNGTIEWNASKAAKCSFNMSGKKQAAEDGALTAGVVQYVDQPPICQAAGFYLGTFAPVVSKVVFDMGCQVVPRENMGATGTTGIEAYRITSRSPKLTVSMEFPLAATYDIITKMDAGTDVAIKFQTGSATEKTVLFFADEAEVMAPPLSDNNGIRTIDLEFLLKIQSNTGIPWEIAFL